MSESRRVSERGLLAVLVATSVVALGSVVSGPMAQDRAPRRSGGDKDETQEKDTDKKEKPSSGKDVDAGGRGWGALGKPVRGADGVYEFVRFDYDEKGKARKTSGYLRVAADLVIRRDDVVKVDELHADLHVAVFGRAVEREVPATAATRGGTDRQLQNALIVLAAENEPPVDERARSDEHPDNSWCAGRVVTGRGGLEVQWKGASYRVTLAKGAPVILRREVDRSQEGDDKVFRKGAALWVDLEASGEEVPGGKKGRPVWDAKAVTIVDARQARTVYPLVAAEFRPPTKARAK